MRCNFCEWRCRMPDSLCHMYEEKSGRITEIYPNQWTTYKLTSTESIPLFHGWPNHQFLQLGAFNCNANCAYCINARVAIEPKKEIFRFQFDPERVIEIALKTGCSGIHFGVNEVTVNLPSALAVAREANKRGLVAGCSSNGYFTEEAADMMLEYFDFFNISLKSLSDDYYQEHVGLKSVEPVMRNVEYLASRTHLEVTTTVVQTVNDHEIPAIAEVLAGIDQQMPWHIFRLLPEHRMKTRKPTDIRNVLDSIEQCRNILPNVYFGNYVGSQLINTLCPSCATVLIERICVYSCGVILSDYNMEGDVCPNCGTPIKMVGSFCDTRCSEDEGARYARNY